MGKCELLISIVPPTSAAFESCRQAADSSVAVPLPTQAPFSGQLWNQLRRTVRAVMSVRRLVVSACLTVVSVELLCQKLPGRSAVPWVEGRVDSS